MGNLNKGGRKKLPEHLARKKNKVEFYMNDHEYSQFKKMLASSKHKEKGPFVRELIFVGEFEITYRDKAKEELIYELGKVGTNINQIAHRLNVDNAPRLNNKDYQILDELKEILLKVEF